MELCTGGELFDRIVAAGKFSEPDAANLMEQMLKGMFYMHSRQITHRDLKPENFIFDSKDKKLTQSELKIIDFGLSCRFEPGQVLTTKAGTPYYVAPEVLLGKYDHTADLWSLGVILFVMLGGYPPFDGDTDGEIMSAVKQGTITFDPRYWMEVSDDAKALIKNLVKKAPTARFSAQQALTDVWVKNKAPKAKNVDLGEGLVQKLSGYRHNKLKKAAIQLIATRLDDGVIKSMKERFRKLDNNGDGLLTKEELMAGFSAAGIKQIPQAMEEIMQSIDSDGSGVIDYTEFLAASLDREQYSKEASVREAFSFFDRNGDGKISKDELREVFNDQSVKEANGIDGSSDIEKLLKDVDKNGDGEIDFDEFMQMMQSSA
jgi:calcium-dependent protein kinase